MNFEVLHDMNIAFLDLFQKVVQNTSYSLTAPVNGFAVRNFSLHVATAGGRWGLSTIYILKNLLSQSKLGLHIELQNTYSFRASLHVTLFKSVHTWVLERNYMRGIS